ncbi:MAG: cytochrome P450 [Pseudomonadota bacterium]
MFRLKYYQKIQELETRLTLESELQPFDIERMRTTGFVGKLVSRALESPLWLLKLLRRVKPVLKLGGVYIVTRADDVEEVLGTPDVFEMPFGPEMRSLTGGSDFVLGMPINDAYQFQLACIKRAFPGPEMRSRVAEITQDYVDEVMPGVKPGFDPVDILLKRAPARVCRDYYGLMIGDEVQFAEWALAISAILFADMGGSPGARDLGLAGAKRVNEITMRSIERIEAGDGNPETPLARLVAIHHETKGQDQHLTKGDIVAIMLGMISGFAPTNLLASGNILDVIFKKPEARRAVNDAIALGDDEALEKALFEALRFKPIRVGPHRYVTQDYKIAKGTRRERVIPQGTTVFASTLSAMFDPDRPSAGPNDDPDRFDPARPPSDSFVFGHDIHWCVGAPLARAHTLVLMKALFSLPNLRPMPGKAGRLKRLGAYPEHLAVTFDHVAQFGPKEQSMVTVALPLKVEADVPALQNAISAMGNLPKPSINEALDQSALIHFCSVTLSDTSAAALEAKEPVFLICEMSGDGSEAGVVSAFATALEEDLSDLVRENCVDGKRGFRAALEAGRLSVTPFSRRSHGLCFSGTPGHSVERIRAEAELEKATRAEVEAAIAAGAPDALRILHTTRANLRERFPWAMTPVENTLSAGPGSNGALIWGGAKLPMVMLIASITLIIGLLLNTAFITGWSEWWPVQLVGAFLLTLLQAAIIFGGPILLILWRIRHLEETDPTDDRWPDRSRFDRVTANEDIISQNHLNAVSRIKGTWFRRWILSFVFEVIRLAAVYKFAPGTLSDINTIHFARWVRLPGTQQLMFFSNYGGSWESYLEDFITKARLGLTGVWSNTWGFPRARFVFWKGAEDAERFKRWARRQQIQTRFWYCAYPGVHTRDIRANAAIRDGLAKAETLTQAEAWLANFGSLARPVAALEASEPQGLLFGPMGGLKEGRLIAVRFTARPTREQRGDFLQFCLDHVHFGDVLPDKTALQLAFTEAGLVALGLSESGADDHGHGFSPAFRQGMDHPHRLRINGDTGVNAPNGWEWGVGDSRPDLVALVYGKTTDDLATIEAQVRAALTAVGADVVHAQHMLASKEEPFGFRDGVSQPVIEGTRLAARYDDPLNTVAPGEFVFGYPDDRDNLAPSPAVTANSDLGDVLPVIRDVQLSGLSDFGRNGTYLVIRQLRQDVPAFEGYCAAQADATFDAEAIGAKIVGRWKNGASLVRYPHAEPDKSKPSFRIDNDFTFGETDPQGLSCPLGSHIRRTNPRDSLNEDREVAIKLANRHRILRRGRRYDTEEGDVGLMFMCLNTDIERQFEFVQQTWVNAPGFHDLSDETDPLIGRRSEEGQYVIPTPQGGRVLRKMPDFVTLKGGGYFFLPARRALRYLRNLA